MRLAYHMAEINETFSHKYRHSSQSVDICPRLAPSAGTASAIACMSVAEYPLWQNAKSLGMNMNSSVCRKIATVMWLLLAVLFNSSTTSQAVDQTFDLLQTKTTVYSNVTVTTKSAEYIVIQHSSGLASLKIADLSPEYHEALGYGPVKGSRSGSMTVTAKAKALVGAIPTKQIEQAWSKHAPSGSPSLKLEKLDSTIVFAVLGAFALLYLFFCYCASLICQKAGKPGGLLVWLPILQYIPLLRAANMSPFWFLAMFVPLLNIIVHIMWSFRIAGVRGQGLFTAIFLILPTYPLAFMYLAFTGGSSPDENSPPRKIALSGMTFDQA